MKIKTLIAVLFANAVLLTASAQDIATCETNLRMLDAHIKSGDYPDALPLLAILRDKCPKLSERIYTGGEVLLKYDIEVAQSDEARQKGFDALASLYAQYNKNFPQNTSATDIKYVMLLNQYKAIDKAELYKKLDAAFKKNPRAFTDYNAVEAYFLEYAKMYEAKDKGITQEQFIERYGEVTGQAAYALSNFTAQRDAIQQKQLTQSLTAEETAQLELLKTDIAGFEAVIDNINILASKYFTCDKLEVYYEARYEANKANAAWLQQVVGLLMKNKCFNSLLLLKSAETLHALKPSSKSAEYLAILAQRKNKKPEAIAYYEQAAKMDQTAESKGDRYYTIASLLMGTDKKQAKEYIIRSTQMNPKSARPYMLLAEMYVSAGKECGLNEFDSKALYWLAIETLKKAEAAEPRYKVAVSNMTQRFAKKTPSKDEVKATGKKKGNKITFGCWINETITIPEL